MLEPQIYAMMESHGLKVPEYTVIPIHETPEIDFFPVALKIVSPKVIHKSDVGGVITGIATQQQLILAKQRMIRDLASHKIQLDNEDHFIVTRMVKGHELYIGVIEDDIFGTVILFGKGGTLLEVYKDVCYIDIHAKPHEIIRAINTTKIAKLFSGFRGSKTTMDDVVALITTVQNFLKSNHHIKEMDMNPIILNDEGFHIVDARLKIKQRDIHSKEYQRKERPSFFTNQRVAVIGASSDSNKVGYAVAKNALGFEGELLFVNAKGGELFDRPLYPSVDAIKGEIDTAVITIPNRYVMEAINALIPKGLKNLIIISAGFKEIGDYESENQIKDLAYKHNFNVIGPNCLGYYESSTNLNLTFGKDEVLHGGVALLAQSGAVLTALMDKATSSNVGFSHIISAGNMLDLSFGEIITMLNSQDNCQSISIYAEGIQNGKAFLESIRRSHKPIVVYKSGKSELSQKAAFSHTGNLSGSYEMFEGLLKSVGVKIEDNIEALLNNDYIHVKNIGVITNAGGPGTILTDLIIDKNKTLYELSLADTQAFDAVMPNNWSRNNPIDIIGDAMSDRYEAALKVADQIEAIEMIYLLITPQFMTDTLAIVKLLEQPWSKPVLPILLGGDSMHDARLYLQERRIAFYNTLQSATAFL